MKPTTSNLPTSVHVTILTTQDERFLLPVLSRETETLWLPNIGPSAMVLARRLVAQERTDIYDMAALAPAIGVGVPRLWEAFNRLRRAKLATINTPEWSPIPCVAMHAFWPRPRAKTEVTS